MHGKIKERRRESRHRCQFTFFDGADVYVDGQFYGNSPATLKLKPGKHTVAVKMSGYKDWSREITTDAGSDAKLSAGLEKVN